VARPTLCALRRQCTDREFLLRVSYMEIYNEAIRDLLQPSHDNLKIHENANVRYTRPCIEGAIVGIARLSSRLRLPLCWPRVVQREVFVGNLTEEIVTSPRDVKRLMAVGEGTPPCTGRATHSTCANPAPAVHV